MWSNKNLSYLKTVHNKRLKDAARKVSQKYKDQRQKIHAIKKDRLEVYRGMAIYQGLLVFLQSLKKFLKVS